ncbi:nuclear transport factor 2 family protein [Pelagibacterium halotolerans]|uniref:nuclear transport factor 2 family protein n=1 Tax=Pelagibacterium halotolerans TaxID=531813 RepID=UPI00384E0BCF
MHKDEGLRHVVEDWFAAVAHGDARYLDTHMSSDPDLCLVGSDPEEMLHGKAAHDFMKREAMAMKDMCSISIKDCEAYSDGDYGWAFAMPEIELLPDHKTVTPRWSGVFHRENGDWKLVQLHSSFGIANDQMLGEEVSRKLH